MHHKSYTILKPFYGASNDAGTAARDYQEGEVVRLAVSVGDVFVENKLAKETTQEGEDVSDDASDEKFDQQGESSEGAKASGGKKGRPTRAIFGS